MNVCVKCSESLSLKVGYVSEVVSFCMHALLFFFPPLSLIISGSVEGYSQKELRLVSLTEGEILTFVKLLPSSH